MVGDAAHQMTSNLGHKENSIEIVVSLMNHSHALVKEKSNSTAVYLDTAFSRRQRQREAEVRKIVRLMGMYAYTLGYIWDLS